MEEKENEGVEAVNYGTASVNGMMVGTTEQDLRLYLDQALPAPLRSSIQEIHFKQNKKSCQARLKLQPDAVKSLKNELKGRRFRGCKFSDFREPSEIASMAARARKNKARRRRKAEKARRNAEKSKVEGCISGLPINTTEDDLSLYLDLALPASLRPAIVGIHLRQHKKTCSGRLELQQEKLDALQDALKGRQFKGRNFGFQKLEERLKQQQRAKKKKKRKTKKPKAGGVEARVFDEETKALAEGFHQFLLERPEMLEQASDRDAMGGIFRDCYYPVKTGKSDPPPDSLEGHILAVLRVQGLVTSKRYGNTVIMTIARKNGQFPSQQEQKEARTKVMLDKQAEEVNKNGVIVSFPPQAFCSVGEDHSFVIEITTDGSEVTESTVLQRITVGGQHRRRFFAHSPAELPVGLDELVQVTVGTRPKNIGLLRAAVTAHFSSSEHGSFQIVRYISLRSGNKEMDEMLKPTAPYERRKTKIYEKTPRERFGPPPIDMPGSNPFESLPYHDIPGSVKEMISRQEFEERISKWPKEDGTVKGYGTFWKNLLWASELQCLQDIQTFDMTDVSLRKSGHLITLQVPGLAEGRPSVLRGDIVHITWKDRLYKGRVMQTRLLEVAMEFHPSFHKRYEPGIDRVDVRFTFSRMGFRTSHEGCAKAESIMKETMLLPSQSHVDDIIARGSLRSETVGSLSWANRELNEEQQAAVQSIIDGRLCPLPYIIFGPPGTGKTTTVVECVYQLARQNYRILLAAPSNDAADILVGRLSTYFPPAELVRPIAYSRPIETVSPHLRKYVVEGSNVSKKAESIRSSRIVVSTVNLAARFSYWGVPSCHFDVVCIDEAGHATEPEVVSAIVPLLDCDKGQLILAGDPKQLGPVITSAYCRRLGLSTSYLERLAGLDVYARVEGRYLQDRLTKLVRNYRSHPSIIKLPNEMFYDNELQCCGDIMTTHGLVKWEHLPIMGFPVFFHSIDGENLREANSPSWFNPQEAQQVVLYTEMLLRDTRPPLREEDIGIITPYARQVHKIRQALSSKGITDVKVGSVETFQGQERRCIIISTVRSEKEQISTDLRHCLGFVANDKRFNVAITRAKSLLIVVGCAQVLATDEKNWLPFLRFCHENGAWTGEDYDIEAGDEASETDEGDQMEVDSSWEDLDNGTTQVIEQEAFAFVTREE